jgi:hypothetical protein
MAGRTPVYTSKIIKAGALLRDTRALLEHWDPARDVEANLTRLRRENLFGKASRARVADVLAIFKQRYLRDPDVTRALVVLARERPAASVLDRLLYFHAAQADDLLHDVVVGAIASRRRGGRLEVGPTDLDEPLARMGPGWSLPTRTRIAQGLLSTLRDFGVLQGAARKRLAPFFLPPEAFAYVAFCLGRGQPSGARLIEDPEWGLFFLERPQVERLFAEAHQLGLLEYHAAGPVVRLAFPAGSLEEYAHVIARREARAARA